MTQDAHPYRRYICIPCGLIYDEAEGDADGGLPPGTRFDDIPDDWVCPDCGVSKADFVLLEAPESVAPAAISVETSQRANMLPQAPDQVVIIGAGMAGWAAAEALRQHDASRPVVLVTHCNGDVYPKPQLSSAAARGQSPEALITRSGPDQAARLGITLVSHTRVLTIDRARQRLITPRGGLPYGRLVLALGAHQPRPLLDGNAADSLLQVNDLVDYRRLRDQTDACGEARVVILGAGLIGCEFADDLSAAGHQVTLIDQASRPLAQLLPAPLSARLAEALSSQRVALHTGCTLSALQRPPGEALVATLDNGEQVSADVAISALGLRANIGLAKQVGLVVGSGIRVDDQLRTSDPRIFALGDCAEHRGRLTPYVRPLRAQAEALGAVLAGHEAHYAGDHSPIVIKTSCCPLAICPPQVPGEWVLQRDDGTVYAHYSGTHLTGFALAGAATAEVRDFEARLATSTHSKAPEADLSCLA